MHYPNDVNPDKYEVDALSNIIGTLLSDSQSEVVWSAGCGRARGHGWPLAFIARIADLPIVCLRRRRRRRRRCNRGH